MEGKENQSEDLQFQILPVSKHMPLYLKQMPGNGKKGCWNDGNDVLLLRGASFLFVGEMWSELNNTRKRKLLSCQVWSETGGCWWPILGLRKCFSLYEGEITLKWVRMAGSFWKPKSNSQDEQKIFFFVIMEKLAWSGTGPYRNKTMTDIVDGCEGCKAHRLAKIMCQ